MTPNILTIALLVFTLIQQECHCWIDNSDQLSNISPVSIPPMEDRVFLFTTTEIPVKFRYEVAPNAPTRELKLIHEDKPLIKIETTPEKTLIDLKRTISKSNSNKIDNKEDKNATQLVKNITIEAPKPLLEPPYEADDTRKVTIQLKPNKWAFGPDKGKELNWKQLQVSTETPKGFYFKAMSGKLTENKGPVEVIQEVNVTNVAATRSSINAYVRKDYDPVPKPNTHIYIKVVSDGTGKIDPVTIHEPEIVYQNGSKKDASVFPATALRQNEGNYSLKAIQNHHANSGKVKERTQSSRNEINETEHNRGKISRQNDQVVKNNSYHVRNDSLYSQIHGKQLPQRVEIEPISTPPPENITNRIKYSPQIPVDYSIQTDYQEHPYINPIKHLVLNQPRYHVTTPSYYSNPDYNGYNPDYDNNPHSFKPVTPPIINSKPTSTTTQLPTVIKDISPPIIPTVPSVGELIYFKNNPSTGLKENMKVRIIHHSDYQQNKTLNHPVDKKQDQIEMQGTPRPSTITLPDDPNAKHVYFNIHHEQHIKHDNGKTTLNTSPVYQVNIIPQYPSAPVHVSLKNHERVTVISSSDNKDSPRSLNVSVVSRNGTLGNDLDDVDVIKTPIVQLSEAGESETQNESNADTEDKIENKTPTSVNDILREIARTGQAMKAKRLQNLTTKNEQIKTSTTSKPARKFTFQTVETTPMVNDTTPTTWNNVFEKFQYLAKKTLKDEKNRMNKSEILSSLQMLSPDPPSINRVAYLPNKYSSVSPLPMVETNLEVSNEPKITPMPTHAKAYLELRVKDSEENMKTFPPGVSKRDWSERMQGQHNKRDLNAKTEKVESADKIPKSDDMFKNMKYETIVENGQIDNINSHSFPFKHVTGSDDSPNDNQQKFSNRKVNRHSSQPYNYQQQSERLHDEKQLLQLQEGRLQDGRLQDGRLQDGRLQDGRLQDGRLQDGRLQDGRLQDGRLQDGRLQDGRLQDGRLQDGRLQDGRLQDGRLQDGRLQDGRLQDGRLQDGRLQDGRLQDGRLQDGRLQDGRLPDGRLPDGQIPDGQIPDGQIPDGQIPDGRLPVAQDPQLSFQQDEFDYDGKHYKIKNGYAYEVNGQPGDTNYDGGIPQEAPENGGRLVYEDPSQTDRKIRPAFRTENPTDLQLELNPTDNGKNVPSKPDEETTQVTQPPEYMDVFEPLPKQKNVLGLTEKQNIPQMNFHRAPVKSYKKDINHNSFQPQTNNYHNGNKNNINIRPKINPPVQQFNKFDTNKNNKERQPASGPTSFSPNLGTTINAPGIGNIRIILVPQNRLGDQPFQIQSTIKGIHIPITIPVTQIPQSYQIESNQQDQTYKHNQDNSGQGNNGHYQGRPQQDEDYPANERYRESNYNQQGVNKHNDYNQPGFNNHHDYNQPGVNKQQDYNQPGVNKHNDYNQPGVNNHHDYNQPGVNKQQDYNQPGANKQHDYNQPGANNLHYNQPGANNHHDYNQQGVNKHNDYNQQGVNQQQDYNQQGANNPHDYNQPGANNPHDYNQPGVNKQQDYNQQGTNKQKDYNQPGANNHHDYNQPGANNHHDYNQPGANKHHDYNEPGANNHHDYNQPGVNKHHNYNQQDANNQDDYNQQGVNKNHNYNEHDVNNQPRNFDQQGVNNQQHGYNQQDGNKQYDYNQQDGNKQYDYNQQGVNKQQDYSQYDQMRPGNEYGQDYNEQYDQPQPNSNRQNEKPNAQDAFYFNHNLPSQHAQPEPMQNYNPQPDLPKKHHIQPTYRDAQNQYKDAGAPPQFIPKPHNPRYNHYETHNAPYDNSFQPQQPSRQENRDEPKRKPSKEVTQFHHQLPPNYDGVSQQDLKQPMKTKSPDKESQVYREHRERVTTELYKNDDIPPMPPFPDFMPHFPYRSYEPRRIRKSPPSTTTSTTTTTTTPTTKSLATPSMTPIKVQVANPSDPNKGPITLLLYIDSKGLGSFNQSVINHR